MAEQTGSASGKGAAKAAKDERELTTYLVFKQESAGFLSFVTTKASTSAYAAAREVAGMEPEGDVTKRVFVAVPERNFNVVECEIVRPEPVTTYEEHEAADWVRSATPRTQPPAKQISATYPSPVITDPDPIDNVWAAEPDTDKGGHPADVIADSEDGS